MRLLPSTTSTRRQARISPKDEPRDDELSIHDQLSNWGAWCRSRGAAPNSALSAEGRYVPPAQAVLNPEEPSAQIDVVGAEAINSSLLSLPQGHRKAIRLRYFDRFPDMVICRKLKIKADVYARFMRDARLMARAVLLSNGSGATIRLDNQPPSSDEKKAPSKGAASPKEEPLVRKG